MSEQDEPPAGAQPQLDIAAIQREAKQFAQIAVEKDEQYRTIDETIRLKRAEEEIVIRQFVTRYVMIFYGIFLAAVTLLIYFSPFIIDDWVDMANWIRDLVLSAVLPIITLVLGYYFGSSSR